MPYPPPLENLGPDRVLYSDPKRRRALFHQAWPADPHREDYAILVAGCGTSQAVRYALREPAARITAIDISSTSLRHTRDLARKYRVENLELHQLPIERVQDLGKSFDLIVCTGVLHHLPDPDVGLRALRAILNRQGALRLMVYAPYGRVGISMMQAYCRLLGIGAAEGDLADLVATIAALPADHPIAGVRRRAKDLLEPQAIADALLHPLERMYAVPELYEWLERCDLSFGRWIEQAPYLAACGMVARSPHAERLAALPARQQHAAIELLRGTMVSHSCIAYRDDRAGKPQPIAFGGDAWRTYVPLSLTWTVCVRDDRVPPGSAAVLINGAHRFVDLTLPIDQFEDRLLGSIDGVRTLDTIVTSTAPDASAERRAVRFFERLWQYDHIVFDASRASGTGNLR